MTIDIHVYVINRTLSNKIPYSNPILVREAVNRNMMVTTDISKITEILNKTNARISARSKAGVKKVYSLQRVPASPEKPSALVQRVVYKESRLLSTHPCSAKVVEALPQSPAREHSRSRSSQIDGLLAP